MFYDSVVVALQQEGRKNDDGSARYHKLYTGTRQMDGRKIKDGLFFWPTLQIENRREKSCKAKKSFVVLFVLDFRVLSNL